MKTATQFAWTCCDAGDYPPPEPTRKNVHRYGQDDACWLCGGPTNGVGWPRKQALAVTFCDHNKAARMDSETVCQACAATSKSAAWQQYCAAYPERGLWSHFPDKDNGKAPRDCNWLYFSHLFSPGWHETPSRARWREILLNPPEPPFLMIMAINGQKQLVFRGRVSQSRDAFWVQADDTRVLVRPERFRECLGAFESLYHAGFSKDSIVSGEYHSGQLAKTGLSAWKPLEDAIRPWRQSDPGLLLLCHHCAQRPPEQKATELPEPPAIVATTPLPKGQLGLF